MIYLWGFNPNYLILHFSIATLLVVDQKRHYNLQKNVGFLFACLFLLLFCFQYTLGGGGGGGTYWVDCRCKGA